jgi:hypothetical protein
MDTRALGAATVLANSRAAGDHAPVSAVLAALAAARAMPVGA